MNQKPTKKEEKKERSLKDYPLPPLPFSSKVEEKAKKNSKGKNTNNKLDSSKLSMAIESIEETLNQINESRKAIDEIQRGIDEIYEKTGWTRNQLDNLLATQNGISTEEWEKIVKNHEQLLDTLKMPPEMRKEASDLVAGKKIEKKPRKSLRTRKAERQKWIPVK